MITRWQILFLAVYNFCMMIISIAIVLFFPIVGIATAFYLSSVSFLLPVLIWGMLRLHKGTMSTKVFAGLLAAILLWVGAAYAANVIVWNNLVNGFLWFILLYSGLFFLPLPTGYLAFRRHLSRFSKEATVKNMVVDRF